MNHTVEKYGLREGAEEFPLMVVLGYIYKCNARCPNCPYNNSDIRENHTDKFMSTKVFNKVANESGHYHSIIRFTGGGEPMLHPDIEKHIKYAKKRGCKTSVITNGSRSVLNLMGVSDGMEFSVDAGSEEEYAIARPGLSWDVLNHNVEEAQKNQQGTKMVASIINQKGIDVESAKKYWQDKVDVVQIRKFLTWGFNEDNSADGTPYLPPEKTVPCPWLFERIYVDATGDVTYCNANINLDNAFANIFERSLANIWLGKEMTALRNLHLEGRGAKFQMCKRCPDWQYRSWTHNYWKLVK